jgi:hypothetical protein
MKRWLASLVVAGMMMGHGTGALADETSAVSTSALSVAAPSPRSNDLAQRYLKAMGGDTTIEQMFETRIGSDADLTPSQRDAMKGAAKDMMAEGLGARILNGMAQGYARVLSERELEALVAFYESPEGRAVVSKMGELGSDFARGLSERELDALVAFYQSDEGRAAVSKIGELRKTVQVDQALVSEAGQEMYSRACKKIECPK